MTLAILAVLPISRALSSDLGKREIMEISTASLPPPEPPPPEPPPPEEEEPEEVEDMESEPPPLDLSALESMLNPGIGDVGAMASLGGFEIDANAMEEMMIFEIADLDRVPRRRSGAPPAYPPEMLSRRIGDTVELTIVIDEKGRVTIEKAEGRDEFVQAVRLVASTWRFEAPKKNGKAVRARYKMTIPFNP